MVDFLVSILICALLAYITHEGVRAANRRFRELDMSPNISAAIAFLFGLTGMVCVALYGAIKVMVKRMLKH